MLLFVRLRRRVPLKYWTGYLTAAILGAISWVLLQFGEKFTNLVDMVYPYVIRNVQNYLAQWTSVVEYPVWQVLAIVLAVLILATLVVLLNFPKVNMEPSASVEPTEATKLQPTEPFIPTWNTYPRDRQLLAQQYFVYDSKTGTFLFSSGQSNTKVYPASITKLFTAYVAMQYLHADEEITAGSELDMIVNGSSVAELEKGDRMTVALLVEGMLLPSGNDAAYVLAAAAGRRISGYYGQDAASAVAAFVNRMNEQAQRMGMTGTHFANPDGIHSDNHYTTFNDLAIIGTLALKNPYIARYAQVSSASIKVSEERMLSWKNTNAIIDPASPYYCPLSIGLKTGQTPYAGSCLLSAFQQEERTLIIGVFGCPEDEDRFADTLQLFNSVFAP